MCGSVESIGLRGEWEVPDLGVSVWLREENGEERACDPGVKSVV